MELRQRFNELHLYVCVITSERFINYLDQALKGICSKFLSPIHIEFTSVCAHGNWFTVCTGFNLWS